MTAGGGDGHSDGDRRAEDALLVVLTVAAAMTDAISYLGLGRVFPANMTGNTVLLALGAATGEPSATARSATALAAFVAAAVAVGAAVPDERGWSPLPALALVVECMLLAAAAAWWAAALPAHPTGAARYTLIAAAGAAMGTQSATVRRLGVSGVVTTYITGTWTALGLGLGAAAGRREDAPPPHRLGRQAAVLAAYPAGALAAAAAFTAWHGTAALVPAGLLAVAAAGGVRRVRVKIA